MTTRLTKKADSLTRRLKSTIDEANSLLDLETPPTLRLQAILSTLDSYSARLEDIHDQLAQATTDDGATSLEQTEDIDDPFDLILDCDEVKAKLKVRLASPLGTIASEPAAIPPISSGQGTGIKLHVKLPKLVIPTFCGDVLKWQEFWDSFNSSIHCNDGLSHVDKFNYLNSLLVGEAKLCISGLPLTSINYATAITLLKGRFANKPLIINSHYKALIGISPVKIDNTKSLRFTFDLIQKHLRCLQALGENTNSNYFLTLITSKLPLSVLLKVEEQNFGTDMNVEALCKTIHNILLSKEKSEMILGLSDSTTKPVQSWPNNRCTKSLTASQCNDRELTSTAQALTSGTRANNLKHCVFCNGDHWNDQCLTFSTVRERKDKIKGHCFICLQKGHSLKDCKMSKPCVYCKQRHNHHRSLCPKQFPMQSNQTATHLNPNDTSLVAVNESVILQTATVQVINTDEKLRHTARLILDTGSQRSYVSKALASKLQLKSEQDQILNVFTFGNKRSKTLETPIVTIGITLLDGDTIIIQANVVPHITGKINTSDLCNVDKIKHMYPNLVLASGQNMNSDIDILIGNDYYLDFINDKKVQVSHGLYLISTKIGWIVSGRSDRRQVESDTYSTSFLTTVQPCNLFTSKSYYNNPDLPLVEQLNIKDLWSLETLGIHDCPLQNDDDLALKQFNEHVKLENGRYSVSWPWKEYPPDLPSNYGLSLGRLKSLLQRFEGNPSTLQEYDKVIRDQITLGIIEKVPLNNPSTVTHYIPHHPVINDSKTTTKLRIVYDASAKSKRSANSLNDCLYRGPVILEDLCSLLLRFQLNAIGLIADIEKAFLQLNLNEPDRDVTRFLWLQDTSLPVTQDNIEEFRFSRVPFGIISSPFLLSATIKHHLSHSNLTKETEKIMTSFYVDNMVTGVKTEPEALNMFNFVTGLFSNASMNLQGWCSNSQTLKDNIPQCKLTKEDECNVNVLGITWDTTRDTLSIKKVNYEESACTKRSVLKLVSSLFDPSGLFSPVMIKAKVFIQKLWEERCEWDMPLTEERCTEWQKIKLEIYEIPNVSIPRYVGLQSSNIELHCFTDASKTCYATAVYLRVLGEGGSQSSKLMFSKCYLTPKSKKDISIPRLELLGVLIGTRAMNYVKKSLEQPVSMKFLWTDSQCVLHWLKTKKILPKFIDRRISEINSHKDITFKYVPSEENPSDLATRGANIDELSKCQMWWNGPKWFMSPEHEWPKWKFNPSNVNEEDVKEELTALNDTSVETIMEPPFGIDVIRFSKLQKLLRVTAYCKRFILRCKKQQVPMTTNVSPDELHSAKLKWERYVQSQHFSKTKSNIKSNTNDPLQTQLKLFLDDDGLLKCSGRLLNADIPTSEMFPKLLPKNDEFTSLVIQHVHNVLFHIGVQHTLAEIRKEYWIICGRSQVYKTIKKCLTCARWEGGPYKLPTMPPLPKQRVTEQVPFTYTGLDYFGPLYIRDHCNRKDNSIVRKVYSCIYTCLTTRAIHLELVNDLTTEEFLLCLRRFISRRGQPKQIFLDNAPQFKLAGTFLEKMWKKNFIDPNVLSYTSNVGCEFCFIPELSPWMGGFYERLISLVKRCLRKTIGPTILTFSQLDTTLAEIEAVLNSRPLVYVSSSEASLSDYTITPGHFLNFHGKNGIDANEKILRKNITALEEKVSDVKSLLETWKKGQNLLNTFWNLWRKDYLLSLRERTNNEIRQVRSHSKLFPSTEDIVLIHDHLPRGRWRLGRICLLHYSKDGAVRSATVALSSGKKIVRPLNLLYPLEV